MFTYFCARKLLALSWVLIWTPYLFRVNGRILCRGENTSMARFHERAASCCMLFRLLMLFVHRLDGMLVRTSGDICRRYFVCPFLFFSQVAPSPFGLVGYLGGYCGVWGLSSGISTSLVLMCGHACSYANRNM